mgnify:FL=1
MNLLIAQNVDGVFQKIGVFLENAPMDAGLLPVAYNLALSAKSYFRDEPAAVSFDIMLGGIEYRINKF